jgi:hypothetical protein
MEINVEPLEETKQEEPKQEDAFSEGYKKAYENLLAQGYQPRKARRYLNSIATKKVKKFMKNNKHKFQPQGDLNDN